MLLRVERGTNHKGKAFYSAYEINTNDPWVGYPIPTSKLKLAYENRWLLSKKTYRTGQTFWKFDKSFWAKSFYSPVNGSIQNATAVPVVEFELSDKKPIPTRVMPASKPVEIDNSIRTLFTTIPDGERTVKDLLLHAHELTPSYLMTDPLIWKALVRNTLRCKNVLLKGPSGEGKTLHAKALADALGRPFFRIDCGQTQDAEAALLGKTHYDPETGTFFNPSVLIKAIQTPNAIINLDEISRLTFEGQNIMFPLLDANTRELTLTAEVGTPKIKVAEGISFICTANIGSQFHAANALDEALVTRCTPIDIKSLTWDQRYLLFGRQFHVSDDILKKVLDFVNDLDTEIYNDDRRIERTLSTRQLDEVFGYLEDGFTVKEVFDLTVFPLFSSEGGADSERSYVATVYTKHFGDVDPNPTGNMNEFV